MQCFARYFALVGSQNVLFVLEGCSSQHDSICSAASSADINKVSISEISAFQYPSFLFSAQDPRKRVHHEGLHLKSKSCELSLPLRCRVSHLITSKTLSAQVLVSSIGRLFPLPPNSCMPHHPSLKKYQEALLELRIGPKSPDFIGSDFAPASCI